MASITALQKVVVRGESTPILSRIIDFAGQDVRLVQVNEAFRKAVEYSANQECRRFMAVPADGAAPDPDGLTPEDGIESHQMRLKCLEIEQAHNGWAQHNMFWDRYRAPGWSAEWVRVQNLMQGILQLPNGPDRNVRSEKFLQALNRLGVELAEAVAQPAPVDPQWHIRALRREHIEDEPMNLPMQTLRNMGFEESLQQRFDAAIAPREGRGALDPETQGLSCLEALHTAQREEAQQSILHRTRFEQLPHLHFFAYEDLLEAERVAHAVDWMQWHTISNIGQAITHELFAGHAPAATPTAWRAWLDHPANAPHLRSLRNLRLDGQCIFPQNIGRFSGLHTLAFRGTPENHLTEIPPEIGDLSQLRELNLSHHHFRDVPAWIGRLQQLEQLYLHDNDLEALPPVLATLRRLSFVNVIRNSIRVLPDEVFRHIEPALSFFVPPRRHNNWLVIDWQGLNQIPFRLWFSDTCMIPLPDPNQSMFHFVLFALTFIPATIINFLLLEIVEPIVTFFRDQFNYSRMVEVDPQPQEEQA